MGFTQFGFSPSVYEGVKEHGYVEPTPIQKQAIPPVLQGRDLMGLAQTGTGKTAAFLLPILERLLSGHRHQIRVLILAPTRELAEQINDEAIMLAKATGINTVTIYGGVSFTPQLDKLRQGVEIVIACPGRLLDHIGQGNIRLSHVEILVLDEADRMLDMGFLPDIKKILKHVPKVRQTLMFSATMPDEIRGLAHDVLRDPVVAQIAFASPVKSVEHYVLPVPQYLKTSLLKHILEKEAMGSVLIFTKTKHKATRIHEHLRRLGLPITSLQGDMSQKKRQAALDGFRDGKYKVLVATDIAARGIDVLSISHVINYDMPENIDAYTHRIGRTGRAERSGVAYTFVTDADFETLKLFERSVDVELILREYDDFDYNAPAPPRDYSSDRGRRPSRPGPNKKPHRPRAEKHEKPAKPVKLEEPATEDIGQEVTPDGAVETTEKKHKRRRRRRNKPTEATAAQSAPGEGASEQE